eukprot:6057135-Prymnesium_polylepis.1
MQDPSSQSTSVRETREAEGREARDGDGDTREDELVRACDCRLVTGRGSGRSIGTGPPISSWLEPSRVGR